MIDSDALAFLAVLSLVYWLFGKTHRLYCQRKFFESIGCKAVPRLAQLEHVIGLQHTYRIVKNLANKSYVESLYERFHEGFWTYSVTIMGTEWIQTLDPENVRAVLVAKFEDFDLGIKRARAFYPLMGKGIFTADGEDWAHFRALLRPSFKRGHTADLDALEDHVSNLILAVPQDDTPVDLKPLIFRLIMNASMEFLFGRTVWSQAHSTYSESEFEAFDRAFEYSESKVYLRIFLGSAPTLWDWEFVRANETIHRFVDKLVAVVMEQRHQDPASPSADAEWETPKPISLARELAKDCQDPIQLRNHLLHILQARRDTSASLISNTIFELARNPGAWKRLKDEVDRLMGRPPTYEQLKQMTYLQNVIREGLRLYPPIPINVRFANKDTTLPKGGGPHGENPIFVKKGTPVAFSPYGMHRRSEFFGSEPCKFIPERWDALRVRWEFVPFSGGARVCLGRDIAMTEASYVIARLAQRYRTLRSVDWQAYREGFSITLSNDNGVQVVAESEHRA